MAQGSDGSIVIDTELDNSGFEEGADSLNSKIDKLVDGVNNIGNTLKSSFSSVTPLLQSIAQSTSAIYAKMTEGAAQTVNVTDTATQSEEAMAEATAAAGQSAAQASQSISNFNTQAGQTGGIVSKLENEVNSLSSSVAGISKSAETGFANGNAVLSFDSKITAAEQKIADAKAKLEAFGQVQIPTQEFTDMQNQVDAATLKLDAIKEKMAKFIELGGDRKSTAFRRMEYDAAELENTIRYTTGEIEDLKAKGQAFTLGSDTAKYQTMQNTLKQTEAELARNKALIDSEAIAQARLNVQTAQEKVAVAQTEAQRRQALVSLQEAQNKLADLAAQQAAPPQSKWGSFVGVLKSVGAAAVSAAGKLAKLSFSAIAAGCKKAVSGLRSFMSQARRTGKSTKGLVKQLTSLKTMLITRLKSLFISQITTAVSNGIKSLAQYSSSFNQSMSNIKNSMTQLGGNIASAFGTILTTIEPVITKLISLLSTAVNYVNAFFSLLAGKKTMSVAKKGTDDYASSVSDASAAQKDLNRQVYGFDELNKRSKESDSSSSTTGTVEYEDVELDNFLPESVTDWVQSIKDAVAAGDWYGVGQAIATGLNTAMAYADNWINTVLRPMGVKWAGIIAQVLNGLVDGFDWALMGKTVADGLNAIADIVNTFLTTFDFENLGTGIGTAINGWFSNIEWDLMGQTVANGLNAIVDTIYGIVSTVDWSDIGSSFSEFVNNFADTADLDKAALSIGTGLNGIRTAVQSFIDGTDWAGLATNVSGSVNTLFDTVDWYALGTTVTNGFNTIVETLATFIGTVDWSGIGASIAQALQGLILNIDWGNLGTLLSNAVIGLLDLINSFVEEFDWVAVGSSLTSGLIEMITNVDWIGLIGRLFEAIVALLGGAVELVLGALGGIFTGLGEAIESVGGDMIGGLFKGIGEAISGVGTWLKENIFDPIVNGIKSLFGINSPSTVFAEMGGYLIQGLLQGISGAWSTITDFFSGALDGLTSTLSGAWNGIKSTASTAWNGIKTTVTTAFTNAKTSLSTTAGNIKSSMSTTWSTVKSNATQTWNNIKSSVSSTFNSLKSSISGTANNIKSTVNGAWTSIKSTTSSKWSDIKTTVSTKWKSLKTVLSATDWTSIGSNLVSGLKNGISNAWSSLTTSVGNLCASLTSKVKSVFGISSPSKVFAEIGGYLDEGMEQGIEGSKTQLLSTASNLADAVTDGLTPASPEIDVSADSTVSSITTVADRLSGIAATFSSIAQILSNMGGLTVPQVAAGTVVPYKTKIDTTGSTSDAAVALDTEAIDKLADGVDERLANESYLLQQILAAIKALHLDIDLDALTQAITKQQRERELNFGGV